jgi:hypothetical protein
MFSTNPVSEIVFGVSLDSISLLRTSVRRSPAPMGARARRVRPERRLPLRVRGEGVRCLGGATL